MSETTKEQIAEMKAMAERLEQDPLVDSAWMDDWGRYGNFTLIVTPTTWDRTTTNRLKGLVNRATQTTKAHLRGVFPPERTGKDHMGRTLYHARFWKFDIDYQVYCQATDSFHKM